MQTNIFNMDILEGLIWLLGFFTVYKLLDYIYRRPYISRKTDKRVFITGCDTGFGFDAVKRFDGHGMYVYAGCLTEKGQRELQNVCSKRLKTFRLDVTDLDNIKQVKDAITKDIPDGEGLWGLINNAGTVIGMGPEEWLCQKDYEEVAAVNLYGLINTTITFLPLIKQAHGRIINTASMAGRLALEFLTAYCVSKYGVECFSDAIRCSFKPFGVSVHIIEPGYHATPIFDKLILQLSRSWKECPQEIKDQYGEEYYEELIRFYRKILNSPLITQKTTGVIDAYEHALLASCPKARYPVGNDCKYFFLPISQLPEPLGDWLRRLIGGNIPVQELKKLK